MKEEPFVVGEPWIVPMDRPCADMIVVCTHSDGRARYLVIKRNRRWPHELNLSRMGRAQKLESYGVKCRLAGHGVEVSQEGDSVAKYEDGAVQRWQGARLDLLPYRGFELDPKYWRMDAAVAPKFLRWAKKGGA